MKYISVFQPLDTKLITITCSIVISLTLIGCGSPEELAFTRDCKLSGGSSELCSCTSQQYPPATLQAVVKGKVPAPQDYGQYLIETIQSCAKQSSH
ncbi:hypothetical protein [Providencia rettgeri]|uniref:hypothetical protein n=1 Tax=Providencia rettgeri TaxID=587 RepID=UPI000ACBC7F6|nr:hypothetical protein [Providencia rettgeri]